jgi:outer membrane immunogenic protein
MTLTKFIRTSAVTFGALAVATQVNAADLYAGGGLKDPVYVSGPTWAGFYLGAHLGVATADNRVDDVNNAFGALNGAKWDNATTGFVGGGQAGYNFQYGNIVFGPELDFGGLAISNKQVFNATHYTTVGDGFLLNVTGRLGYAFGPALLYVKGGYAYWDGDIGGDANSNLYRKSGSDGWTFGGGLEYKVTPTWSVKAEYLYADFGDIDVNPVPAKTIKNDLSVNEFKVGVNYFVGNVYSPLK